MQKISNDFETNYLGEYHLLKNLLPIIKKGIRSRLCHSINRYAKVNKTYMKDYYKK